MKKESSTVSELEGAILGEIGQSGELTAYAVRKAFALSPADAMRASKGAIYPAIARLAASGLIETRDVENDGRRAQLLRLTAKGKKAARAWICDAETAAGPGLDPFRTRSGFWRDLPAAQRKALYRQLETTISERVASLKDHLQTIKGQPDEVRVNLEIAFQESRLAFLKSARKK